MDFKNIEKSTREIQGFETRIKEVDKIAFQTVIQDQMNTKYKLQMEMLCNFYTLPCRKDIYYYLYM